MTRTTTGPVTVSFPALGTTAVLVVADGAALPRAEQILRDELAAIDLACSRFRPDSELSRANAAPGREFTVSALFAEALDTALRAAELTGGVVDPTVGPALTSLGYDRTFASLRPEQVEPAVPVPATGWRAVGWDPSRRRLRLPAGTGLDLGATAKALAADRSADRIAHAVGCGVLVSLGGDLATAGSAPQGGWQVAIADDHAAPAADGPVVAVHGGGLATSGTTVRTWRRGGRSVHHIVDPGTGNTAPEVWRTVSVAAATCVDANTAATAAVVLGETAPAWLRERALPARLVRVDGSVVTTCGWPEDSVLPPLAAGGRP
jgi:thiamine biosynthesis lipoprotein